jgi:2'-5' RNA ligase
MRTFIAIDLPEAIRAEIFRVMESLRPAAPRLRWSRPEGLHITLKFIGEIPPANVEQVKQLLTTLPPTGPFQISIRQSGFFPNPRRPRVFWLGVETGAELAALARRIDRALAAIGVAPETRDYNAHLTLARIDLPASLERLPEALRRAGRIDMGSFVAEDYFLYESKLAKGGSIYTKLHRFALREERGYGSTVNS